MNDRLRRLLPMLLALLLLLLLVFFSVKALHTMAEKRQQRLLSTPAASSISAQPDSVQPIAAPSAPPLLDTVEEPLPEFIEEQASAATEKAYELAQLYQDVYEGFYSGGGLVISEADCALVMERLGCHGYAAADIDKRNPMVNYPLLLEFNESMLAGEDCSLNIYEVCLDAGLICHGLRLYQGQLYLNRTRLAWLSSPGSGLQGGTASVTYSQSFRLTEFQLDGEYLYYDYIVPNNPSGSNHDGHIDTETYIYIGPQGA